MSALLKNHTSRLSYIKVDSNCTFLLIHLLKSPVDTIVATCNKSQVLSQSCSALMTKTENNSKSLVMLFKIYFINYLDE